MWVECHHIKVLVRCWPGICCDPALLFGCPDISSSLWIKYDYFWNNFLLADGMHKICLIVIVFSIFKSSNLYYSSCKLHDNFSVAIYSEVLVRIFHWRNIYQIFFFFYTKKCIWGRYQAQQIIFPTRSMLIYSIVQKSTTPWIGKIQGVVERKKEEGEKINLCESDPLWLTAYLDPVDQLFLYGFIIAKSVVFVNEQIYSIYTQNVLMYKRQAPRIAVIRGTR